MTSLASSVYAQKAVLCVCLSVVSAMHAQSLLVPGSSVSLRLQPNESARLLLSLPPGSCAKIELRLKGGLVAVTSPHVPRWAVDLGRGAKLPYILQTAEAKPAWMDVASIEHQKQSEVEIAWLSTAACNDDDRVVQEAESALAQAEAARRRWKDAPHANQVDALYDQAASLSARLHQIPLQRLAETQHARYLIFQASQFIRARDLLQQAAALPSSHDAAEQALTAKTLSSVEADLGDYDAAIADADRALSLYRETGDVYWQGIVLGNVSPVYAELGRYKEAAQSATEALADAESEKDTAGVVYCVAQLANIYRAKGDFESAFQILRKGIEWVEAISYSPLVEAELRDQIGEYYANMGQWREAAQELQRCLRLEQGHNDPTALEARGTLAAVREQQHQSSRADAAYSDAITAAAHLKLPREQTLLLLHRARERSAAGQDQLAIDDLAEAQQIADALGSPPLKLQTALATGEIRGSKNPDQASRRFQIANQLAAELGDRQSQAAALVGIARTELATGKSLQAISSIEAGLSLLEHTRAGLNSRQLAVSYFDLHRRWYATAIDIAMKLDKTHPGADYTRRAFDFAERARARVLLDNISQQALIDALDTADDLRPAIARNQHEIGHQEEVLDKSAGDTTEPAAKLRALYQQQDALEAEARANSRAISPIASGDVATLADIQQKLLTRNSALISFSLGDHASYRWVVTSTSVAVLRLPGRDRLNKIVLPLEQQLAARHPRPNAGVDANEYVRQAVAYQHRLDARLHLAGSLLLAGLPPNLHKIYIVGDGPLLALPWGALRVQSHPALEQYLFVNEPSASVALKLKMHPSDPSAAEIAVVAESARGGLQHPGSGSPIYLASAAKERLAIQKAGGTVHPIAADTSTLERLPPRAILHYAAHTIAIKGSPELIGIRFAEAPNANRSRTLWLHDIYQMKRTASLVVLSGCSTAGAAQLGGEGLNSLSQAFFFAGAHAVVGSLWNVDDAQTSTLMTHFYRAMLVRKQSPEEALRTAQLKMLHTGAATVDWASFVINGIPSPVRP